ncbi:hypothetical protein T492DRAFT_837596 [Pavlovales sp. CCMP2436]|nr:hypothetical protein T492DRAFT_837596 [Pavlovales sp. CCMP2436]
MAALALVVLWATPGWVLFPGSSNSDLVGEYNSIEELLGMTKSGTPTAFRWTQPSDINSAAGIGSGIAYAYDPRFCDDILLRFDERASAWLRFWEFVTCESVKQSVLLAFDTWAANHPHLHFLDVSDECTSKDLWKTVEKDACTSTNCARCSIAEIVISTFTKNDENDHSGARIVPVDVTSTDPRGTNGLTQDGGKFEYVELQYANDLCWYLDQTFCAIFFDAQIAGVDVETLMLSLFITIELIACFVTLVFVLSRS